MLSDGLIKKALAPRRLLFALLALSAFLLILPFFFSGKRSPQPRLSWSPGYWELVPEIGMARIVPFARGRLVSPSTGATVSIREPATNRPIEKY